ncbi:MAG: Fic family protein [Anaerolineae bacterium]|nr:Fic family protein [Anaerolineae bacterium]
MIEKRLLARIDQLKRELDALRPLPAVAVARLKEHLNVEWTYNSNAIEGNTLTLRETQLILQHGVTIGGKSLREHFEVVNHSEAIEYVEHLAQKDDPITGADIRQIHNLVLAKIDDASAGRYRTVAVRIAGARHVPPESWEVAPRMDDFVQWLRGNEAMAMHPIERAAYGHHIFVAIHPFVDGNGRTGRLLLNLLLFRAGYPPAVIEKATRRQYYKALSEADRGNFEALVNMIARVCERSLRAYLEAVQSADKAPSVDDRWISLAEAAKGSEYSQEYLSLLARTGKLRAKKEGRNWLTTKNAIAEYREGKLK